MIKHIKRNPSKSPLNFFKKKSKNKEEKEDTSDIIKKIDNQFLNTNLFSDDEPVSTKYEPNSRETVLLKMMYLDDVDSDYVKSKMRISDNELEKLVEGLLDLGLVKYSSNNEIELTREGVYYITSNDMDLF